MNSFSSTPSSSANNNLADAGFILKKVLASASVADNSNLVLRCDELPLLKVPAEELKSVFANIISFIVLHKPVSTKLYLHVSCTSQTEAPASFVNISFSANIAAPPEIMREDSTVFNEISSITQRNRGRLVINQLKNSGCIISVILPGKV